MEHFAQGVLDGGATGVLAASVFHFGEFSIAEVKKDMASRGLRFEADLYAGKGVKMSRVLDDLYLKIKERKQASPSASYSAMLFERGTDHICQKVGEEAVETVISALRGTKRIGRESADLIYHLLVLWADAEVEPDNVWDELRRRENQSGLEEKLQRDDNN